MIERFENEENQYREICSDLGTELRVIEQRAIYGEHVHDQTRYEFNLIINDHNCKFILINGQETLVIVENLRFEEFVFSAQYSSKITSWFQPKKTIKIGGRNVLFDGSNQSITKLMVDEEILSGFLYLANSFNVKTTQAKTEDSALEIINPDLKINCFNVPMDSSRIKPAIRSISRVLEKLSAYNS